MDSQIAKVPGGWANESRLRRADGRTAYGSGQRHHRREIQRLVFVARTEMRAETTTGDLTGQLARRRMSDRGPIVATIPGALRLSWDARPQMCQRLNRLAIIRQTAARPSTMADAPGATVDDKRAFPGRDRGRPNELACRSPRRRWKPTATGRRTHAPSHDVAGAEDNGPHASSSMT